MTTPSATFEEPPQLQNESDLPDPAIRIITDSTDLASPETASVSSLPEVANEVALPPAVAAEVASVRDQVLAGFSQTQRALYDEAVKIAAIGDHAKRKRQTQALYPKHGNAPASRAKLDEVDGIVGLMNGSLDPQVRKVLRGLRAHLMSELGIVDETKKEAAKTAEPIDLDALAREKQQTARQILETAMRKRGAPSGIIANVTSKLSGLFRRSGN